jgi:HEAT repeat protein
MRWTRAGLTLAALAVLGPSLSTAAADATAVAEDEQRLKAVKLEVAGPALLAFFQARANPAADPATIATLVRDMGNDSDKISTRAIRELVSLGPVTVPWLRRVLNDPDDALAVERATALLQAIEGSEGPALPAAAARLVALRRPTGAVKVLLAYLPFADDDSVVDEVRNALSALAVTDGRADADLVAALKDERPIRRAVAAEALCQAKAAAALPAVRYLLQDSKPTVRLRAALALGGARENEAIPVLIELLGKLPEAQAGQAQGLLNEIAGEQAPAVALGKDEATRKVCRDRWHTWWQAVKDSDLMAYFRQRTLSDVDRDKLLATIRLLGNDSYRVRQKAARELVQYRSAVVPLLTQALRDADAEVRRNAQHCLNTINAAPGAPLSATNARLMGYRKPPGALEVLLAYLPFADDDTVADEVRNTLAALALPDGKPHPTLIAALTDKSPPRRAAAAEALLRAGIDPHRTAVADLLKDQDLMVRLRTAIALASAREKLAVPVLIDLLAQAPMEESWRAEEVLRRLADEKAPTLELEGDDNARKKCREAWLAWWKDRGAKLDMARIDSAPRLHGYTVIGQYTNTGMVEVVEIGRDGKKRWSITGLTYAYDMQMLRGDRLLIPEYSSSRVTERDFKGNVKWELNVQNPINAQRLPNGHTFVAGRNRLVEVDRNKKEVFSIQRQRYDVMAAQKLRNGQIVMITNLGQLLRLDTKGTVLKSFSVGQVGYYGGLEALANGNVLVSDYNTSRVVEYDEKGKIVWQASVQWPSSVTRLPNGNTLVSSQDSYMIVELDRKGKKVWEHKAEGRPWRVRRR